AGGHHPGGRPVRRAGGAAGRDGAGDLAAECAGGRRGHRGRRGTGAGRRGGRPPGAAPGAGTRKCVMLPVDTEGTGRRRAWSARALYVLGVAAVAALLGLSLSAAWQGTFEWLIPQLTADLPPEAPATP